MDPCGKEHIALVVEMYRQMSLYESEPGLVIAYGSMWQHGADGRGSGCWCSCRGCAEYRIYNTSYTDTSFILRDIFQIPWIGGRQSYLYE